jgi:hypothetical protein
MKHINVRFVVLAAMTAGLLAVVVAAVIIAASAEKRNTPDAALATIANVNGEPIAFGEFMLFYSKHKASAFTYFHNKYKGQGGTHFWTTEFSEGTPLAKAVADTLDELKRVKVEQLEMKKYGIVSDTGYERFIADWQTENKSRLEALAQKKAIYGPQQYDAKTYYLYLHANRLTKLKEQLGGGPLSVSDAELMEYKAMPVRLKTEWIRVDLGDLEAVDEGSENGALPTVEEIRKAWQQGRLEFEKWAQPNVHLEQGERSFDESTYRTDREADTAVYQAVANLQKGEVSEAVKEGATYLLFKCIQRTKRPLEEVKEVVKATYIEEKYEHWIGSKADSAELGVESKLYKLLND